MKTSKQAPNLQSTNTQSQTQPSFVPGLFSTILFVVLLSVSFYLGVLYNQKQTLLSQQPDSRATQSLKPTEKPKIPDFTNSSVKKKFQPLM